MNELGDRGVRQSQDQLPTDEGDLLPVISGLSGFLAHDLGNALSALSITLDLLAGRQDLPEKASELVGRAIGLQRRLGALADALGALGGARPRPEPPAVHERLEKTLGLLKLRERFQVELELDGWPGPEWLGPSPALLELCLRLLLRNAADATPTGGRLGIRTGRVSAGRLRLTVWDEGMGVAPAIEPRLLRQVVSTKTGNGVGLLLVRAAVEGPLRGLVTYARNVPCGACFSIELPID